MTEHRTGKPCRKCGGTTRYATGGQVGRCVTCQCARNRRNQVKRAQGKQHGRERQKSNALYVGYSDGERMELYRVTGKADDIDLELVAAVDGGSALDGWAWKLSAWAGRT